MLVLSALAWAGFGLMLFIAPERLDGVGLDVLSADARIEVRGFYGGLELGIGAFTLWCAFAAERFRPGLMLTAMSLGGLAAGRLVGIAIEGGGGALLWMFAAVEACACLAALFALGRLQR